MMGCAVIATPRGGTEEVIINDSYGLIVDGGVASLKSAMKTLIIDAHLRKRMSEKIHNRITEVFNWDKTASDVGKELYSFGEVK
jgi:glycosyltransferase involved in cell wall biosynthesis